jgi:outer membrane protein OmpA-like peptidoglycan-associated protein
MRFNFFILALTFALSISIAAFAQSPGSSGATDNSDAASIPLPTPEQTAHVDESLKDILFDFDHYDLRPDDRVTLGADADWIKSHPDVFVVIEGDADERGDIVYNLALSEKRATITRDTLVSMGVPADRLVFSTGWGKLYPVCFDSDEACWSRNRRAHFELWGETNQTQAELGTQPGQ